MNKLRSFLICGVAAVLVSACIFDSDDVAPIETGLQTMESNGVERSYYVVLPEEDPTITPEPIPPSPESDAKPLIIGFHGSFASHRSWVGENERYGFVDEVGDGAIMVFPDALALGDGQVNWNFDYDFLFFEDLLAELDRRGLTYDRNRLFIVGHSSGAGMANEIGCLYGDIVRAVAISSGSLISGGSCIGSIAVIQTQGEIDQAVPINVGGSASRFWTLYNGHNPDTSIAGVAEPCIDYSDVMFPNENYPVQWCQHPAGHPWTDFNSPAFWKFFSGLPIAQPTIDTPPGGGNDAALGDADTTISFTLRYPDDIGTVTSGAITLYPEDYTDGQFRSPDVFLTLAWNPNEQAPGEQVTPGTEVLYSLVPITFFVFSGEFDVSKTYKMQFSIYVEGGSKPIPTPGLDHKVLIPINFVDKTTPIILQETLDVTPVVPW